MNKHIRIYPDQVSGWFIIGAYSPEQTSEINLNISELIELRKAIDQIIADYGNVEE